MKGPILFMVSHCLCRCYSSVVTVSSIEGTRSGQKDFQYMPVPPF